VDEPVWRCPACGRRFERPEEFDDEVAEWRAETDRIGRQDHRR
jgi:hypothetical protein